MKKLFILSIFCLFSFSSFAQITIEFSDYIRNAKKNHKWKVNGATFKSANEKVEIKTNYPKMDTIFFWDERGRDTVLTRLKPNREYIMTIGCCDAGFDIYYKETFKEYQAVLDTSEIWFKWIEVGKVKVEIQNNSENDTLIFVYGDFAGVPTGQVLIGNQSSEWTLPFKGYYTTNK
ncbi:hypothetical protein ACE193_12980 [Bernardetia sp. OM2101]|uniref:hypothetical protein n=1 Tax=Bernardetia sp. OM2101 TaxID=3344876 RepID=UPI0035CF7342